ncbi:ABC transporter substrate binding protein [Pelosinus sp. sgz500959]|uniref:ABC transporter substrate binding protein n=1 Tax=Pelosinus sp. sgz500959 TaxID=3242472 RepID=UPI00366D6373
MTYINTKKCISLLFLIVLLMISIILPVTAQGITKKSVLVLNSYHKDYKWSDNIVEGITSVFGPNAQNIDLQIEYMDTHRISDNDYIDQLSKTYKYKFQEKRFDVIIASDDPAFAFLLKYHDQLFPNTPIVFCGVNYFDDSMLTGQTLFTGVVEGQDIKSTLDIALKLHPATKNVYVINDNTMTGKSIEKTLQETIPQFKDQVNFISLEEYDMNEIKENVAHLPPDSLVLFLIFFQDRSGNKFSYSESISQISASSTVPIYGVWDFSLGSGLVGGMLTSGYYQGELAANLAQRILHGEKPSNIPIVKNSPNHYMFDRSQMKRFNIKPSDLPQESIIINDTYSGKKQILVLNSYHSGMAWTDSLISGIKSILNANTDIDASYEFMDTKQNTGPEYIQKLYEIYKYKFQNKHFDGIIISDDDAYNFLLKYGWEIFPNIPIVFCGVNYFQDSDLADNKLITGVLELVDVQKTIEIALKLQPNIKNIVIINDKSLTGEANKKLLNDVIPNFSYINFIFYEDMNMSEIQDRVAKLSNDTIILLLSFNKDKSNNIFSYEESIRIIAETAVVPIYSVWDFYMERGIVGGMLSSGYYQGETAASMLLRILNGEKPQDIPVVKQSPNKYMFDYKYLAKYDLNPALLPADSIIINKPLSIFERYSTFFLAGLLVILCTVSITQRKKARDQLKILKTPDYLTGILNRGTGLAFLQQEIDHSSKNNSKLTVIFTDVNHLKIVNDTYGHQAGDNLIQATSQLLLKKLRKSDAVCRFGGDEFLLILPGCDRGQAMELWRKIEDCIDFYNSEQHHNYPLSVSHGFAEYDPTDPISVNDLINKADTEMYAAKRLYKLTLKEKSR